MRKNSYIRGSSAYIKRHIQYNNVAYKSRVKIILILICALVALFFAAGGFKYAYAEEDKRAELNQNISELLDGLDLSGLQELIDGVESPLGGYGSNAREIIEYLISGNADTNYSGYISEILGTVFKGVIGMIPTFAVIVAIALLCAVVSAAEGGTIGKSTAKIVKMACYAAIIAVLAAMIVNLASTCVGCVERLRRQIEIITPILATLTVLTGGTSSAAIYQPSAIFLSGGAVEIISGFIFPATITVIVLDFMSKLNKQVSFSGVTAFLKSTMKWVIGITVTIFSIFITAQSSAGSLFDGIIFKATKFVVGNSVPIVGNFLSSGFDMLTSAGLLIKSSVGICGIIILLAEILSPVISLIAFSVILKGVGAIVQPIGENELFSLLSDISKDVEYLLAGLLTVAFMYALVIMLVISSANSFI